MTGDPRNGQAVGGFQNMESVSPVTRCRSYAGNAYYGPEQRARPNLTVMTNTRVVRIMTQETSSGIFATGVIARMPGTDEEQHIDATDEVILCAGAIQSPQVLELSGIGGRALLKQHDIPVKINNPNVGENLQDHPISPLASAYTPFVDKDGVMPEAEVKALFDGRLPPGPRPQRHLTRLPPTPGRRHGHTEPPPGARQRAHSVPIHRGRTDAGPALPGAPLDLEILARSVQFTERIVSTPPFSDALTGARYPDYPSADVSLDRAKEIVRQVAFSCYHPAGTCAMRPRADGGVVDERLVVHGTTNLRVVDASVFPLTPSGNIQATVYAVAERAADFIKESSAGRRASRSTVSTSSVDGSTAASAGASVDTSIDDNVSNFNTQLSHARLVDL
ncbi:Glucose-methanol-choline oxidoreductase [Apiospora phragmitis]|uniref:Glucose-methanol-choline oxidoreductase n=1 Tax=Apiospora phragmitis TaxID=2905665 RepID=A0ABR1VS66_9PEZI